MMKPDEEAVFATLTGAEDTLSPQESRNGLRHVAALSMTKLSDGLLNPKLVLAWLAQALGAPAVLIGLDPFVAADQHRRQRHRVDKARGVAHLAPRAAARPAPKVS